MIFKHQEPPIVLSVGGSLIVPNGQIDVAFLKKLNVFIREEVARGRRFFLVAGGGSIARTFRDAGKSVIGTMTEEDLDWLAIHVTRLNGHLLRTIFQDIANPRVIETYDRKLRNWKEPVVIGAGWKPGWSTDYDAVVLARDYGAHIIINLSNIDWVYDKDPRKFKDAKPIEKITWEEMEELVGSKWTPGLNMPFDPIATKLAKKLRLTVMVVNGSNFENLKKIVDGDEFKGTVIMPYKIDASFYDRAYYTGKKRGFKFRLTETFLGRTLHSLGALYKAILIKVFINPRTCLDVGCGKGMLVHYLRILGIDAQGLELSPSAIDLAHKRVRNHITVGNMLEIPFPDNHFDLVTSYDVLEHVERAKIKKAVEETVRVSRKLVLHKIFTRENGWIRTMHQRDFSRISVFGYDFWKKIFNSLPGVSVLKSGFFVLPSFFETVFLLEKKPKS